MVKILYSVCGEGMGHAVRSDKILSHLRKNHEIEITAAEKAYPFLRKKYGSIVKRIEGNTYVYKDNEVKLIRTIARLFWNLPYQVKENLRIMEPMLRSFRPDLIISDFESASHYLAKTHKIPCISIDNIHATTDCKTRFKTPMLWKAAIRFLHPRSDFYIIPSFTKIRPLRDSVHLVKPIIRDKVKSIKPNDGEHVVVYQTSDTNKRMLPELRHSDRTFKIYGLGKNKKDANLNFKSFDEIEFLKDIASAKYVIVNGGFTVISEALYFGKPILSIPVGKQFEQRYNAQSLREMGYGNWVWKLKPQDLVQFEKNLDRYKYNISKIPRWDCKDTIDMIQKIIKQL